jgi:sigma54-dependent transcription regulator
MRCFKTNTHTHGPVSGNKRRLMMGLLACCQHKPWRSWILFNRLQLAEVLRVCRASRSLAEKGRILFN